jgi:CheY-like chemotaxis protein
MSAAKRVLVVDDEDKILFIVRRALDRLDGTCQVQTAANGQQALELARQSSFDLVVTDLRMPGMDGLALTEALRELDDAPRVIWMTAYHCSAREDERKRLGVCCCLDKPIEIGEIRRVVSEALWPARADPKDDRPSVG